LSGSIYATVGKFHQVRLYPLACWSRQAQGFTLALLKGKSVPHCLFPNTDNTVDARI
jgi:hypothetical protein